MIGSEDITSFEHLINFAKIVSYLPWDEANTPMYREVYDENPDEAIYFALTLKDPELTLVDLMEARAIVKAMNGAIK